MAAQQMIGIEHDDERGESSADRQRGAEEGSGAEGKGEARWRTGLELRAQWGRESRHPSRTSSILFLFLPPPPFLRVVCLSIVCGMSVKPLKGHPTD